MAAALFPTLASAQGADAVQITTEKVAEGVYIRFALNTHCTGTIQGVWKPEEFVAMLYRGLGGRK